MTTPPDAPGKLNRRPVEYVVLRNQFLDEIMYNLEVALQVSNNVDANGAILAAAKTTIQNIVTNIFTIIASFASSSTNYTQYVVLSKLLGFYMPIYSDLNSRICVQLGSDIALSNLFGLTSIDAQSDANIRDYLSTVLESFGDNKN